MPTNRRVTRIRSMAAIAGLAAILSAPAYAQQSKSAAAAKELGEVLDRLKLDSIAAPDPSDPNAFVAALYFPGVQLLVVSAKYSAPTLMAERLAKKEYRDIYIDLNSASVPGSKTFIMDQSADGLSPRADGAADSWEEGSKTVVFDGDWRKAKLSSEDEYEKTFAEADARYAQLLALLAEQAKKSGS